MSHQQSFSYKGTGLLRLNQYYARINVLAQGHKAVTPRRLEPAAPLSRVKHSTTESLRSLKVHVIGTIISRERSGVLDSRPRGHGFKPHRVTALCP